jgi:hypothetical protein
MASYGNVAQLGHRLGDELHVRRLVALPAVGDRREVGAIGLEHEAFERHAVGGALAAEIPQA